MRHGEKSFGLRHPPNLQNIGTGVAVGDYLLLKLMSLNANLNPADTTVQIIHALPVVHRMNIAAIARENKIIIPGGLTTIQEGDHVVVVTKSQVFDDLTDILL